MKSISSNFEPAPLPDRITRQLAAPPSAGSGVHSWLFTMALQLHAYREPGEIVKLLTAAVKNCGRTVPPQEILDAVRNSKKGRSGGGAPSAHSSKKPRSKWPSVNEGNRAAIVTESPFNIATLKGASPAIVVDGKLDAEWFLARLFPNNPLLCIGHGPSNFATMTLQKLQQRIQLWNQSLIVPSPMSAPSGITKDGRTSQHTLSNTGPRRYLVTEFDSGTADEQAALIMHLAAYAPLVLVLSSGGKSIHAWWNCVGVAEADQLQFFRYAVSLGADPATWCRSQFVRLPQGWREDKKTLQQVYYYDPDNLPVDPIDNGKEDA